MRSTQWFDVIYDQDSNSKEVMLCDAIKYLQSIETGGRGFLLPGMQTLSMNAVQVLLQDADNELLQDAINRALDDILPLTVTTTISTEKSAYHLNCIPLEIATRGDE